MVFVSFPAGFGNCFATLTSHFRTRHVIDSPKLLGASESAEGEGGGRGCTFSYKNRHSRTNRIIFGVTLARKVCAINIHDRSTRKNKDSVATDNF